MESFDSRDHRPNAVPLPQLCYDVAYFILPHYAYHDFAKLADLCLKSPSAAGPFFYVMACQMREVEPIIEDAKRFTWHHGKLDDGREYFVLEYPTPPPVHISDAPLDQLPDMNIVLAPHFSAILRNENDDPHYFVLGQAPMGGGTTLRHVAANHDNANLGPGPEPTLAAFLERLDRRPTRA